MKPSNEPTGTVGPSTTAEQTTPKAEYKGGIYADPSAALAEVREYYKGWTTQLTQKSFELSMAIIGANWAVFGGLNQILRNGWAKWSIAVVVIGLLLTLLATWSMSELLRKRIGYAEDEPSRWQVEFNSTRGKKDPWPFTDGIEQMGLWLRCTKTFVPIVGGLLFFLALALP
jgi:hypothetical protein